VISLEGLRNWKEEDMGSESWRNTETVIVSYLSDIPEVVVVYGWPLDNVGHHKDYSVVIVIDLSGGAEPASCLTMTNKFFAVEKFLGIQFPDRRFHFWLVRNERDVIEASRKELYRRP
jgi:hypothetical protein